jgi:hypothetical protein
MQTLDLINGLFETAGGLAVWQWASFAGGLVIVAGNAVWLYHAVKYRAA